METKTQQSAPINPAISNAGGVNQNPTDPGILSNYQFQVLNKNDMVFPATNWCKLSFEFYAFCMHYNFNKFTLTMFMTINMDLLKYSLLLMLLNFLKIL